MLKDKLLVPRNIGRCSVYGVGWISDATWLDSLCINGAPAVRFAVYSRYVSGIYQSRIVALREVSDNHNMKDLLF